MPVFLPVRNWTLGREIMLINAFRDWVIDNEFSYALGQAFSIRSTYCEADWYELIYCKDKKEFLLPDVFGPEASSFKVISTEEAQEWIDYFTAVGRIKNERVS